MKNTRYGIVKKMRRILLCCILVILAHAHILHHAGDGEKRQMEKPQGKHG